MLTFFAMPKAFSGHFGVIQRNAIRSWTLLQPHCEVLLLGDDEGTKEAAEEFGATYIPDIARNEFGTPLMDSIFMKAEAAAKYPLLCYLSADIILMSDFMLAAQTVASQRDWFLMSGQRWNLDVTEPLDFGPDWESQLREGVRRCGILYHRTGMDYYFYTKGVFDQIPPFAIGRTTLDAWLLYRARTRKADLIDATKVVMDVHQNHDYSHHPDGVQGIWFGPETQVNVKLAGGRPFLFIIKDRTFDLTSEGLKPARDLWRIWRLLRTAEALWPSMPLPVRLMVRAANNLIDISREALLRLGLKKPHEIYPGR